MENKEDPLWKDERIAELEEKVHRLKAELVAKDHEYERRRVVLEKEIDEMSSLMEAKDLGLTSSQP